MSKNSKKITATIAAVIMAAAISVTAFAADYGTTPSHADTSSSTSSTTNGTTTSVVSATTAEVEESIDNAVSEASADSDNVATVKVKNTGNLVITASTLKKLANTGDGVLEIVSPKFTLSIDADSIEKASKLNLSSTVRNAMNSTVVKFATSKDFGCEVKITITSCKMSKKALKNAHVYVKVKDPETGKTVLEDLGLVELDEDGNPVITVTKGGEYTIK